MKMIAVKAKYALLSALFVALFLSACKENIDESARYVFKEETILSYLEKHDDYTEYVKLLKIMPVSFVSESTVAQLLAARGNYTVFAPTNDAIQKYLEELVEKEIIASPSWDAFTDSTKLDSVRHVIVHNSVIDGGEEGFYETYSFPTDDNAEMPMNNMNGRKLAVHMIEGTDSIYMDGDCPINIRNRNIYALNGIIHQMEKVVAPSIVSLGGILRTVIDEQKGPYLVTARCIMQCGYIDTLEVTRDEAYERLYTLHEIASRANQSPAGRNAVAVAFWKLQVRLHDICGNRRLVGG